jgi:methionyl-tRNA formyltransferase
MRIVLFGAGNKGTQVLKKLLELKQEVVGVVYLKEDNHENIWYEKINDVAYKHKIDCFHYKNIDDEILQTLEPDVIFVVGWRYKIPKEQYSIPPKGTIVFHDSLLPKYRGFAPMNWAIINGEEKTGATMFYISDDIDSGDIIAQLSTPINHDDTANTVETRITDLYLEMLEAYFKQLKEPYGMIGVGVPQNHKKATYTCKRVPEDGLIDWTKSAKEIYNLIRGLSDPYPNAYSNIVRHFVYITKATMGKENDSYVGKICGRVINIKGVGVEVLTGKGTIIIEQLKMDGKLVRADEVIKSLKSTFRS